MELRVGTSGYSYKHWAGGVFYPQGLPADRWLEFYCQAFDTVELNVTFYRLPKPAIFNGWAARTPDHFRFAVKGSRYITHLKRLKDVRPSLDRLAQCMDPLAPKTRCVLWQLPPGFAKDEERLRTFCGDLRRHPLFGKMDQAFEFRHESWFQEEIYGILKRFHCGCCMADEPRRKPAAVATADFLYVRFHGSSSLYASDYTDDELRTWIRRIGSYGQQIKTVYVYFNNDAGGYAPKNAARFRALWEPSAGERAHA